MLAGLMMAGCLGLQGDAGADRAVAAGVKVVGDKNPDASGAEEILAAILRPGMSDQEKCEALFDYLVVRTYHHQTPERPIADALLGRPSAHEVAMEMDAIKVLNVYGHAICGSHSWYHNYLFNAMGLPGRIDGVNGHTVPEVKYGGRWRYFDVDMMGYVRKPDGTVASVDDIKADRSLLMNRHARTPSYFFKFDGPQTMWAALRDGVRFSMYGRKFSAHSMNLSLREGESMTRWFRRQWAPDFHYYAAPLPGSPYNRRLGEEKEGPMRDATHYLFKEAGQARYGNWEVRYRPPLEKPSALDGFLSLRNVARGATTPHLRPAGGDGPSEAVLNYYSPYLCAGAPGDLARADDDRDGAVFEGDFATADGSVSYSLDLGRSWVEAHRGGGPFKVDLTPALQTRAGWQIKLAWRGPGSGLRRYASTVRGQLSPAMLPFVDGKTRMTFTRSGLDCLVYAPDVTGGEAELRRAAHALENYQGYSEGVSGHHAFKGGTGAAIFRVEAPGDIVRVQAAARFGGRRPSSVCGISFSLDEGRTWVVACEQPVIRDEDHPEAFWMQCVDGILDVEKRKAYSLGCIPHPRSVRESAFDPKPSRSVLVKVHTREGDCSLVSLEGIYVLYRSPGALPLQVTHAWSGGRHVEKIGATEARKEYGVDGGSRDANESITIEALSD